MLFISQKAWNAGHNIKKKKNMQGRDIIQQHLEEKKT
jgi:hypothetical protein